MEIEDLKKEIEGFLDEINEEEYPETNDVLQEYIDFPYGNLDVFFNDLVEADNTKPVEPHVLQLLTKYFEEEVEKNTNGDAICNLGALYYSGRGGEQNYEKAVKYYETADKLGCRQAGENLGYCYYYGRVGEVDYKKAFHYFLKGALDNHLVSLYKIGDMYKNGYYVEKDEKEAYRIYKKCKEDIDDYNEEYVGADVYIRLADCYFNGTGCEVDYTEALRYYQKAEVLYVDRMKKGDFLYKKQYERSIAMQDVVREKIRETLPKFEWTKTN